MRCYNIPIFVPHEGCPFDCIFCNQRKITGRDTKATREDVFKIIEEHLKTLPLGEKYVEAAFFGGSFTGISAQKQCELLEAAKEYLDQGKIQGIRLSTRPDYISEEILDRLKEYGVTTIELGVQSMDNEVLKASNRGHTREDVIYASQLIKDYGFNLGLQMMTGLPCDTPRKSIETAKAIIEQKPKCVRIYPTLVLKETRLEALYKSGEYVPQTVEEAANLCKKLIPMFKDADIEVIRVSLVTTEEISDGGAVVAGPYHPAFREIAEGEIYFDEMVAIIENDHDVRTFLVNPKEVSKAVGNKRRNILRIKEKYGFLVSIKPDDTIDAGKIKVWKE
ncbi:MAG: radical SAM protein [Clostridia bacterium]|nr:radical SAM protein [Clostridia bacterium]